MIVKLHLIFTLYSLCASVFKGERRALPWRRGVVCGEAAAAAALWCCPKAACAHVSRAREFNYNSRERELLCFIFLQKRLAPRWSGLGQRGKRRRRCPASESAVLECLEVDMCGSTKSTMRLHKLRYCCCFSCCCFSSIGDNTCTSFGSVAYKALVGTRILLWS